MANVRQTGTSAELLVQKLLHSLGYQFSVKAKGLPGTPDIVSRRGRWAIFVHGCFWHAHECSLWKIPNANKKFWKEKFEANRQRDRTKLRELRRQGYSVLTLWQCELKNEKKTRSKLIKFLTKASIGNGHPVWMSGRTRQTPAVTESYMFNEADRFVSRIITKPNGKTYEIRREMPVGISVKQDLRSVYDQAFLRSTSSPWHRPLRGSVRAADLFSGCGGLSLGTREASIALGKRFEPVLAIDEDSSSLEVYKQNFEPLLGINRDIWSLLVGEVGERLHSEERALLGNLGTLDILLAGPPCEGNSDLNNHTRRKDNRNKLYERIARFAEIAAPTHIIAENVPTIVHGKDRALDRTIERLIRLGYNVDTNVVNLATIGVPQHRKRHILVASNRSISINSVVERYKVPKERTLRWAIADLVGKAPGSLLDTPSTLHPDNVKRINYLMKNNRYDLPNELRPACHQDEHSYISMYGRLRYDQPAQTITTGFGSPGQGRYIHPSCGRTITPHEAARLQFFPDSFDFSSVQLRTALANMIGNAVPMLLAFVLCLAILS